MGLHQSVNLGQAALHPGLAVLDYVITQQERGFLTYLERQPIIKVAYSHPLAVIIFLINLSAWLAPGKYFDLYSPG